MDKEWQQVMIAYGKRQPGLTGALTHAFEARGGGVLVSEAAGEEEIRDAVSASVADHGGIGVFFYMPKPVAATAILGDDDLFHDIREELEGGMRWLRTVGAAMLGARIPGRIVVLSHITSIVPTGRFSYCSSGQAALNNLSRVAALEWASSGIQVNNVVFGWRETPEEQAYVEQLREAHRDDHAPLLPYITDREIAEMCVFLCNPLHRAANGSTIVVDGGYSVSRNIRPVS
ncbi:SDR family oxidoreductase [Paenibacillus sp.]|uniref:SDR family NAD(P)-dependent oxidoreductase n=1 Tax=Paenibacillus sp. TaxID=58172 RepID=UPI002D2A1A2D|nr:SDR family oxidoreductase [Paenibacillus sp.]HZG56238.1 SDR family oxidoreductase [Paenibacillus sp.]